MQPTANCAHNVVRLSPNLLSCSNHFYIKSLPARVRASLAMPSLLLEGSDVLQRMIFYLLKRDGIALRFIAGMKKE